MKITRSELLEIIKEEVALEVNSTPESAMQEGIESFTPENLQIMTDAMKKMAPLIGTISLPLLIGFIYEKLKEMGAE